MEAVETELSGSVEAPMKHHFSLIKVLTTRREPAAGPCQRGSLTGAVSSQRVTEEYEAWLNLVGNQAIERMGIRELYCETYKSISCESRPK